MIRAHSSLALAVLLGLTLLIPRSLLAHCDTLDGPVVSDARAALEKADVTPVLKWVRPEAEEEVRAAFQQTLQVRALGDAARSLADQYFFETLVRIHREGEGAPYTGLKPAGSVEPAIAAADQAMQTGSVGLLAKEIAAAVEAGIKERFDAVMQAKEHVSHNVEAGRRFVEAYVTFIHYVERLHRDAASAEPHAEAVEPASEHRH